MKLRIAATLSFISVLALWLLTYYLLVDVDERGTFGDMFGGLNALFSGFAFAGLIFAILLQSEELKLQRQELAQTREELSGQKEQMRLQNEVLQLQRFESTFFNLLSAFSRLVSELECANGNTRHKGKEAFVFLYSLYRSQSGGTRGADSKEQLLDRIGKSYTEYFGLWEAQLGHYFRTLRYLVAFVDSSNLVRKSTYIDLVRAQLSSKESLLLFYHCLSGHDQNFALLAERHALYAGLPQRELIDPRHRDLVAMDAWRAAGES